MDNSQLNHELAKLPPGQRLQLIRKKILKKNQNEFCKDGIIREGTLKAIERDSLSISEKNKEKLIHKLSIEGIICDSEFFEPNNTVFNIVIKERRGDLLSKNNASLALEEFRKLTYTSIPIYIDDNSFSPFIKKDTLLLVKDIDIQDLSSTLTLIQGDKKKSIYYTTYEEGTIYAEFQDEKRTFSEDTLLLCSVYQVQAIYYRTK